MVDSIVEELARKRLGRTIKGKWRLDRLLGVGGMAAVYAATHRNGARVAIKMLHATISASQQIRARFIREGYLANKVDHPGVVRVLDDDIDDQDQAAFLVMDLVVGSTLSDRAMERLLNDGEVLDVAEQVLQVLGSAHKQGIIHRDLKPDNLLVDLVGKVHVLDFGIARLLDDANGNVSATKTGTAFGTPGFMAPEQALGKTALISAKTDLYALGATLFALVCGDFVHAADNPQELMILVATQPARSLGELAPHMAKDVIALIDKATKNESDKRWGSAEAMLAEVRRIKAKLGITSSPVLPIKDELIGVTPMPPIARQIAEDARETEQEPEHETAHEAEHETAKETASPKSSGGASIDKEAGIAAEKSVEKPIVRPTPPRPVPQKSPGMLAHATPRPAVTPPMSRAMGAPSNGSSASRANGANDKPSTHIATSRGMAPIAPPGPPTEEPIESSDLLESESPPPIMPRDFGESEVLASQRNSTPAASFDAHAMSPAHALETGVPTPTDPARRRKGAVIAVLGSAALLGLIAIAVSSGRGHTTSSASEPAGSEGQPTTKKAPSTSSTVLVKTVSTEQALPTTQPTVVPSATTTAKATAAGKPTPTPTNSLNGGATPTATSTSATAKPSVTTKPTATIKKPIDVGY